MSYAPADLLPPPDAPPPPGGGCLGGADRSNRECACKPGGVCKPGLYGLDYSVRRARDKAAVTNAASAIDFRFDASGELLRRLSVWLVAEFRAGAPDTLWSRDFVYSPDGSTVWVWDRERGVGSAPLPRGPPAHTQPH